MTQAAGKALITGGLGFIGYHLSVRLLAEGFEVHVLDDLRRGAIDTAIEALKANRSYRLVPGDVTHSSCLDALGDGYTHVFHLAAIVGVQNVTSRPYSVLRENVLSLMRVLDWSRGQRNLCRLIFPSTSEVYAGTLETFGMQIPTPESTPLTMSDTDRPRTVYMLSKVYGEALCRHAGIPFTVLRPHNVYGPRMGMAHVIPQLLQRAHRALPGDSLVVFSPEHTRTFCYVADAVEIILRLALSPAGTNGTFNVGAAAEETTITDLASLIVKTIGKKLTIEPGPVTDGSAARRRPDVSLATFITRYQAEVQLAEGIRRTYDWYRSHGFDS